MAFQTGKAPEAYNFDVEEFGGMSELYVGTRALFCTFAFVMIFNAAWVSYRGLRGLHGSDL